MPEEKVKKDINTFQSLPQEVQDFLMDDKSTDVNVKIVEKFKLTPEEEDLFFDITDKVIYKELKLENFLAEVKKIFKFDDKKARDFALEIFGTIFLPIESYLGDVQKEIKKMGSSAGNFAVEKIETEEITPEILVKKILAETEINLDKALLKKFEGIVLSRFREARDEAEALETLKRGKKLGGLELSEEDAKKISQNLEAKLKSVKLTKTETIGAPSPDKSAFGAEDEREVAHIVHQLEKRGVEIKTNHRGALLAFSEEIKKSAEKISKYGKITFTDENLKNKFGNIVSARLRDIRDEMETMEILTRDKGVGGLGLDAGSAKKISELIETEFQLLSEARKAKELQKHEEWKKKDEEAKAKKEENLKTEEQNKLDEKFHKIVGNKPAVETGLKPVSTIVAKPAESARPIAPSGKPLIEDISFTPKLLGPIEELRQISLVDFRRLGKNPEIAAEKIKDKIELLEDESHLKKMGGLKAWRESEVAKIYFEILRQSINDGKSIDEIIAARNAGKIPSLTPDEFKAIMKLSEMLRV